MILIPKVEKENLSNILSQGAKKNKEEMEALLSTHGGAYKTDFGLRGTIDFGDEKNDKGWNRLFGYIQGNVQDERIAEAIEQKNYPQIDKTFNYTRLAPISPKAVDAPESKLINF